MDNQEQLNVIIEALTQLAAKISTIDKRVNLILAVVAPAVGAGMDEDES